MADIIKTDYLERCAKPFMYVKGSFASLDLKSFVRVTLQTGLPL